MKPHGGFIRSRWAVLPYKLGPSRKTLGWLLPCRPALGERGESGWSTHFLSLPFPGMSERSQAKKNQTCSGFWTGSNSKQCGNYGWQEGRCAVERGGGGCQAESSPANGFKRATKELKEKQTNRSPQSQRPPFLSDIPSTVTAALAEVLDAL